MEITVGRIRRHNVTQLVAGSFGILGAVIATAVMYGFFWGAWWFVTGSFGVEEYRRWASAFRQGQCPP